ncbi:MAG: hypothetical protein LBG75_02455 [Candidatus Nomurabacteria bacterium]|jgi:hypothetical protein|nr:hypothetical protein [Candidatus Nomurabacteria bacterium]
MSEKFPTSSSENEYMGGGFVAPEQMDEYEARMDKIDRENQQQTGPEEYIFKDGKRVDASQYEWNDEAGDFILKPEFQTKQHTGFEPTDKYRLDNPDNIIDLRKDKGYAGWSKEELKKMEEEYTQPEAPKEDEPNESPNGDKKDEKDASIDSSDENHAKVERYMDMLENKKDEKGEPMYGEDFLKKARENAPERLKNGGKKLKAEAKEEESEPKGKSPEKKKSPEQPGEQEQNLTNIVNGIDALLISDEAKEAVKKLLAEVIKAANADGSKEKPEKDGKKAEETGEGEQGSDAKKGEKAGEGESDAELEKKIEGAVAEDLKKYEEKFPQKDGESDEDYEARIATVESRLQEKYAGQFEKSAETGEKGTGAEADPVKDFMEKISDLPIKKQRRKIRQELKKRKKAQEKRRADLSKNQKARIKEIIDTYGSKDLTAKMDEVNSIYQKTKRFEESDKFDKSNEEYKELLDKRSKLQAELTEETRSKDGVSMYEQAQKYSKNQEEMVARLDGRITEFEAEYEKVSEKSRQGRFGNKLLYIYDRLFSKDDTLNNSHVASRER